MTKRIVIAAGGTGGHFYPGLALAQTLKSRGWQAVMLLKRNDPALKTLEQEGFAAVEMDMAGLSRKPAWSWFSFPWKLFKSFRLSGLVLKDFKPDCVVSTGGYIGFPAILAAFILARPRAVHESNSALGLSNRLCLRLGAELFMGLPQTPSGGGVLTGTPVREAFRRPFPRRKALQSLELDENKTTLLIFGGSQGARTFNHRLPKIIKALGEKGACFQIIHVSGRGNEDAARRAYEEAGVKVQKLFPFCDSMETAYGAADLVLCRAGASTIAELAAQKKPAVLIPYPAAAGDHQMKNALVLEKAGAARVVPEPEMGRKLPELLERLLVSEQGKKELENMSAGYDRLGLPSPEETPRKIADAVESLRVSR